MNKPPLFINKFVPGLYQLKAGHTKRAIFFTASSFLSSAYYLSIINDKPLLNIPDDYPYRQEENNYYFRNYKISKEVYENGIKEITEKLKADEESYKKRKSIFYTVAAGVYAANLFDTFIISLFEKSYKDDSILNRERLNKARISYNKGVFEETEDILQKLINEKALSKKEREEAYIILASIYLETDRMTIARGIVEALFELNPHFLSNSLASNTPLVKFSDRVREESFTLVSVSDVPAGTQIYVDGESKCIIPSKFIVKIGKTYKFGFLAEGYNLVEQDILVNSKPTITIKVDLEESYEKGSMIINSDPPGAEIYINDELKGITPNFIDNLAPGYYRVKIKKANREGEEDIYSVFGGESTVINAKMKRFDDYLLMSEILPGFGQIKSGHTEHGLVFMGLSIGFLSYYFNATKDKPNVFYYSNDALKIEDGLYYWGDQEISLEVYNQEIDKINISLDSKRKREEYENRKSRIQSIGIFLYVANLVDTYYLVSRNKDETSGNDFNKLSWNLSSDFDRIKLSLSFKF